MGTEGQVLEAATATPQAGIPVPGEPGPSTPTDSVEESARRKGWKSKDEYKGDPESWVDAKEFLGREQYFVAIKDLKEDNKKLRKTVEGMARTFHTQVTSAINERLAKLKADKREAIEAGDADKVEKIEKAIEQQKAKAADIPTAKESSPEIEEWVRANPWYHANERARRLAIVANEDYLKKHPGDISGSLDAARDEVRKAYPELFADKKAKDDGDDRGSEDKGGRRDVQDVERGGRGPTGRLTVRNLTREQRLAHDAYIEHGVMTSAEYLKSLEETK